MWYMQHWWLASNWCYLSTSRSQHNMNLQTNTSMHIYLVYTYVCIRYVALAEGPYSQLPPWIHRSRGDSQVAPFGIQSRSSWAMGPRPRRMGAMGATKLPLEDVYIFLIIIFGYTVIVIVIVTMYHYRYRWSDTVLCI